MTTPKPVDQDQLAASIEQALEQLTNGATSLVPVVAIARSAAAGLGLAPERNWLDLELRGYADPRASGPQVLGELLGVETSDLPERIARCRALLGEVILELRPGQVETLPFPYFATQSVAEIEAVIARGDGRIRLSIPWNQLPDVFRRMFMQYGVTERTLPTLPVYFKATTFAEKYRAIRGEVAGFLSMMRLMCKGTASSNTSFVVENVSAHNVQIVQAAQGATVTINGDGANQDSATMFATLMAEIEGIQDLIIGNRKQILSFVEDQELVKADLLAIVRRVESRIGSAPIDLEMVRSTAEQVVAEMQLAGELHEGQLRRLVKNGITQSALGSTIFEVLKSIFT